LLNYHPAGTGKAAWMPLLAVVLVVALLWAAQPVLLPLAVGIILAFMLTPLVRVFDRLRLPRFVGVSLTMLLALAVVGGIGYVVADQFAELSTQVTKYTWSMRQKVADLRVGNQAAFAKLTRTVDRVTDEIDNNAAELRNAQPVRVVPTRQTPMDRLQHAATAVFEPFASAIIVLVLVAFMLGQREDLRDRLIRLTGSHNVTVTTRLLNDAADRVSRFLVAQTLVNILFGACVAGGLYWIGVPYPALWGGLTAFLRFVPFVGTLLAALMPACLAFAMFPGWAETLQTLGLFLALDFLAAYFLEPVIFGQRTGVSSFALLISALFWIWVWGPVGLVLSTPLTVCIAVLGRHVRSLRFLAIMFADEPALQPYLRYYQRLLARDEDEASVLVNRQMAELGVLGVMDQVLLPALVLGVQHHAAEEVGAEDLDYIVDSTQEIVGQIRAKQPAPAQSHVRVLALATHAPIDRLTLEMLCAACAGNGFQIEAVDAAESIEETIERVAQERPGLACIVAISPERGAEARNYCRRIRAARPDTKLLVLRVHAVATDVEHSIARMKEAGADYVAMSIQDAVREVGHLLAGERSQAATDVSLTQAQDRGIAHGSDAREPRIGALRLIGLQPGEDDAVP
jgi:predicted PurR-regulated permease PerM/DNA-binding NarL/FixJ family response regulator